MKIETHTKLNLVNYFTVFSYQLLKILLTKAPKYCPWSETQSNTVDKTQKGDFMLDSFAFMRAANGVVQSNNNASSVRLLAVPATATASVSEVTWNL